MALIFNMKKILLGAAALLFSISIAKSDELVPVNFLYDVGPMGNHYWVSRGVKEGVFKNAGFDVRILGKGNGSVKTALALVADKADVGYQDFSGVVIVNSQFGIPKLKAVFVVDDKSQDGIYALPSSGIKTWEDLDGRKVGGMDTGVTRRTFPLVTDVKPNWVNVPIPLRVSTLLSGEIDAVDGFLTTNKFNLEKAGADNFVTLQMSEKMPFAISRVITVSNTWLKKFGDKLPQLRAAFEEALLNHIESPAATIAMMKGPLVSTGVGQEIELRRAVYNIEELILTDSVRVYGFNKAPNLTERLNKYIDVLSMGLELKNTHPYSTYYDFN
jgi:ABC-type nitrate/sulfonate/bicarbonate transport system substrate-binding protein